MSPLRHLSLAALVLASQAGAQARPPVAFTGATIIDGTGRAPIANGVVLVAGGRITAVGPAAQVTIPAEAERVALTGKFIIPGLINSHGHINTPDDLKTYAVYGVTTVVSLGGENEQVFAARASQNVASLNRARVYVSGPVLTPSTPDEARTMVAGVAAQKVDWVKIRVDDNLGSTTKMAPEVYRAVIDESHKLGLRVAAHIFYLDDAKELLRAGVDMIAHSVRDRDLDDETITLLKARNVPYCPTLTREISVFAYEMTPKFFSDPFFLKEADRDVMAQLQQSARMQAMAASSSAQRYKAGLVVAMRNLKKAADAGVTVVMGTDTGAAPERFQGYFEHLEMQMMAEAGLSPAQVLRASTVNAAASALRRDDVGRLATGRWADFVALRENPLVDVRRTQSISSVWIAGNPVPAAR